MKDPKLKGPRPHFKTGSLQLDHLIGGQPNRKGVEPCPGWPRGVISEVVGKNNPDKLTVALEAAVQVIREGGTAALVDWNHRFDLDMARDLGVPLGDPESWFHCRPSSLEEGLQMIHLLISNGVELVILSGPEAAISKEVEGKHLLLDKMWMDVLRKFQVILNATGSHLMACTSRDWEHPERDYGYPGKQAWRLLSHLRVGLSRLESSCMSPFSVRVKILKTAVSSSLHHEDILRLKRGGGFA